MAETTKLTPEQIALVERGEPPYLYAEWIARMPEATRVSVQAQLAAQQRALQEFLAREGRPAEDVEGGAELRMWETATFEMERKWLDAETRIASLTSELAASRASAEAGAPAAEPLTREQLRDELTAAHKAAVIQAHQLVSLRASLASAQALANGWIRAALYAAPMTTDAFDPTNPEAFGESRRHAVNLLELEVTSLRADLERSEEARKTAQAGSIAALQAQAVVDEVISGLRAELATLRSAVHEWADAHSNYWSIRLPDARGAFERLQGAESHLRALAQETL